MSICLGEPTPPSLPSRCPMDRTGLNCSIHTITKPLLRTNLWTARERKRFSPMHPTSSRGSPPGSCISGVRAAQGPAPPPRGPLCLPGAARCPICRHLPQLPVFPGTRRGPEADPCGRSRSRCRGSERPPALGSPTHSGQHAPSPPSHQHQGLEDPGEGCSQPLPPSDQERVGRDSSSRPSSAWPLSPRQAPPNFMKETLRIPPLRKAG